jgi:hypothetical protein
MLSNAQTMQYQFTCQTDKIYDGDQYLASISKKESRAYGFILLPLTNTVSGPDGEYQYLGKFYIAKQPFRLFINETTILAISEYSYYHANYAKKPEIFKWESPNDFRYHYKCSVEKF